MNAAAIGGMCLVLLGLCGARALAQSDNKTQGDDKMQSDEDVRAIEVTPEELAQLNARYANEPSVGSLIQAALHAQRRNPQRFAEMAHRARMRGLVPNLDLGARRGQGVDLRSTTTDELGVHLTTADDLMLFATLRFEL
ncbi:MAG TPA: hypothetical protein VHZ95_04155, partial [Polyangiales bacterium]|nr:hypothetical protein [Polyangiales bacterium]